MIQKTFEIALAMILAVTTLAFILAVASFTLAGFGYLTQQAYGSPREMVFALFMIAVTSLLLTGVFQLSRSWMDFQKGSDVDALDNRSSSGLRMLQTKKGPTSAN